MFDLRWWVCAELRVPFLWERSYCFPSQTETSFGLTMNLLRTRCVHTAGGPPVLPSRYFYVWESDSLTFSGRRPTPTERWNLVLSLGTRSRSQGVWVTHDSVRTCVQCGPTIPRSVCVRVSMKVRETGTVSTSITSLCSVFRRSVVRPVLWKECLIVFLLQEVPPIGVKQEFVWV